MLNTLTAPSRRAIFKLLAAAPIGASLASCTSSSSAPPTTLPAWVTDVENIVTDIANVVLPAGANGLVATLIADGKNLIAAYANGGASAAYAQAFQDAFTALVSGVGGTSVLANLGTFGTILQMGLTLLPGILGAVGIALSPAPISLKEVAAARAYLAALR
jgi:hypothetical protein